MQLKNHSGLAGLSDTWSLVCSVLNPHVARRKKICVQCLHMVFLWRFRVECPVLSRKMLHWSRLLSWLMGSFGFGLGWCWYKRLPLSPSAQSLCQVSMVFCLAICFAVSYDVLVFSCGIWEPIFASPSALSFMDMSELPGIHWIVMVNPWRLMA